jgi:hypothetical protein
MNNKLGFKFVCPKCKNTVFLGKVDFDMEDWLDCTCGHGDEEEVLKQFFWLLNPDFMVHGCHPYAIGSLEHCISVFNKTETEDLPKAYTTLV